MSDKANFMAAQFGGAFEMYSPDRLVTETVTARRGNSDWLAVSSSLDEGFEEILAIIDETQDIIAKALASGILTAYVHNVVSGLFYVIPACLWADPDCAIPYMQEGRLFRTVLDDGYARSIPTPFLDTPIMIPDVLARHWLRSADVKTLSARLEPQIPYEELMSWLEGLGEGGRGALTNPQLLEAAKAQFPLHHAGRRVIEQRRTLDGLRIGGRPTKSAEKIAAG